jgi:parvulin-like peptidyl-prolyl isomerase
MKLKLLSLCALLVLPALARTEVLASAGSETVTREDFDQAARQQAAELKHELAPEERKALLRTMLNQRLLVAEAKRRKLDKDPAFKAARAEAERRALAEALYNAEVASKASVTPAEVKQFYDANPKLFDTVELSQIVLVPKPGQEPQAQAKAAALAKKLQAAPKGFAAAAKAESDDQQTKAKGGLVGEVRPTQMLPELANVAFTLKNGGVSDPIPTRFGFHILLARNKKHLPFDKVADQLAQDLRADKAADLQKALLEAAAKENKVKLPEGQP